MFWRSGEVIRRLRRQVEVLMGENDDLRTVLRQTQNSHNAMVTASERWRELAEQRAGWRELAEKRAAALAAVREALNEKVS